MAEKSRWCRRLAWLERVRYWRRGWSRWYPGWLWRRPPTLRAVEQLDLFDVEEESSGGGS